MDQNKSYRHAGALLDMVFHIPGISALLQIPFIASVRFIKQIKKPLSIQTR
jgi:hypothetical protein